MTEIDILITALWDAIDADPTPSRWASTADMCIEAKLLGLDTSRATPHDLVRELRRRGLEPLQLGACVAKPRGRAS